MSQYIEGVPAYGRDYTNQAQVKADWAANKDFMDTRTGRYFSKADAERLDLKVIIRYAKLRKVVNV